MKYAETNKFMLKGHGNPFEKVCIDQIWDNLFIKKRTVFSYGIFNCYILESIKILKKKQRWRMERKKLFCTKKNGSSPGQVGCRPVHQNVAGSISNWGRDLGCRLGPWWGRAGGNLSMLFLSPPPPSSLFKSQ